MTSVNSLVQTINHVSRVVRAGRGFRFLGAWWLRPWLLFLVSPGLRRLFPNRIVDLGGFKVRVGETDICCLADLFVDYDIDCVRAALPTLDRVLDAGANIGAFSFLIRRLAPSIPITALEPEAANYAFLAAQPFSGSLDLRHAALGAREGTGVVVPGENAATHRVAPVDSPSGSESGRGTVPILPLGALLSSRTLVKMDIEGGEKEILASPLPDAISILLLEWHYPEDVRVLRPEGAWQLTAKDRRLGATCWKWERFGPVPPPG
jgi:FkbM family methyltransferase